MSSPYNIDRVLILIRDRETIRTQVQGQDLLFLSDDTALMKGMSTDAILSSHAGRFSTPEELAPYALTGVSDIPESFMQEDNISYRNFPGRMGWILDEEGESRAKYILLIRR